MNDIWKYALILTHQIKIISKIVSTTPGEQEMAVAYVYIFNLNFLCGYLNSSNYYK